VDEQQIARHVRSLGAALWAERQEASRRLAELGVAARPSLERAARGPDPEVAWRARRLLDRIAATGAAGKLKPASRHDRRLIVELFGDSDRPKLRPGEPSDLDALVRALGSDRATDVAHAREVLLSLASDALDALMRGLDQCSEVAGVEIMELLQRITGQKLGYSPERWRAWWRALQEQRKD
jgi:hypothetical protein